MQIVTLLRELIQFSVNLIVRIATKAMIAVEANARLEPIVHAA
jgi:hypothetical protein